MVTLWGNYEGIPQYFVYFFVCYALSIVPGALMFKRKYLPGLKKLGYFAKRGGR
jgi:hypothetical protein